jgi:hypothetical protein
VFERGDGISFAAQPLDQLLMSLLRAFAAGLQFGHDFQRYRLAGLRVRGAVDHASAAAPQLA